MEGNVVDFQRENYKYIVKQLIQITIVDPYLTGTGVDTVSLDALIAEMLRKTETQLFAWRNITELVVCIVRGLRTPAEKMATLMWMSIVLEYPASYVEYIAQPTTLTNGSVTCSLATAEVAYHYGFDEKLQPQLSRQRHEATAAWRWLRAYMAGKAQVMDINPKVEMETEADVFDSQNFTQKYLNSKAQKFQKN